MGFGVAVRTGCCSKFMKILSQPALMSNPGPYNHKFSVQWNSSENFKRLRIHTQMKLSSCLSSQFGCDMLMKKTKNFLFFKWKINFSFCLTNKEKLQQILLIEKEIQNTQFNIHITAILMSLVGNNWKICFVLIKMKERKVKVKKRKCVD